MTLVAYTTNVYRQQRTYRLPEGAVISSGVVGVTSPINGLPVAHVPQQGTSYTICGKRVKELAEIDDDAAVRPCKNCIQRLEAIQRKQPHLIIRLLGPGNTQLA